MPKVGVSRPYVARYHDDGMGTVSYTDGIRAGRAVEYSLTANAGDDNAFYADNGEAENSAGTFSSGELTLGVAELENSISKFILGLKSEEITADDGKVLAVVYDDDMSAPYLGFGIIVKYIVHGVTKYRATILSKIKFNIPEDAVTTQGENIEWQTDSITAKVMRSDDGKHRWKIDAMLDSEAKADAFICHVLGIKNATLDELTVQSAAGTSAGKTKLTVTPELTETRTYRYKTGESVALPALYQDLSDWQTWDGSAEIDATTGHTIVVAEVDTIGLAMAAGSATVTANPGE